MRRRHTLAIAMLGVAVVSATAITRMPTKLVWNATASTPIGLYAIAEAGPYHGDDLVAVMPPQPLAAFLVGRGYIGDGVPLMKHVAALPGQRVCRIGRVVTVDSRVLGEALERDRIGRPLPVWQGCRIIARGELFLMNSAVPSSLDGRYFGPLPASAVIGRALPVWTDESGDGRFVWRARTQVHRR